MAAEAALCMALDTDKLLRKGGVLTPASCMGDALVRAAYLAFTFPLSHCRSISDWLIESCCGAIARSAGRA